MFFLFTWVILRFHVSFPGCTKCDDPPSIISPGVFVGLPFRSLKSSTVGDFWRKILPPTSIWTYFPKPFEGNFYDVKMTKKHFQVIHPPFPLFTPEVFGGHLYNKHLKGHVNSPSQKGHQQNCQVVKKVSLFPKLIRKKRCRI